MFNEQIEVSVTIGTRHEFSLRMVSREEETALRHKTFGLSDDEKKAGEFAHNVELLCGLSEKMPVGLFPNKPKETVEGDDTIYIESFAMPRAAIKAFFAEKNPRTERIAYYAVRGYFLKLQPDEFFL